MAFIDETDEYDRESLSSEDFDYIQASDEEDEDEDDSEDGEEELPITNVVHQQNHVPRVTWFETEEYAPTTFTNQSAMPLVFHAQHAELSVGSLFRDKQTLISAVKQVHISTDRSYIVERSNPTQFKAKCVVPNCPWKLRAAKKKKHDLFEITKCGQRHTCLVNEPLQDHGKLSIKLISKIVKPHVSLPPNPIIVFI